MPRPFTRAKALENQAFLKALRATGNASHAATRVSISHSGMRKRRLSHPAFAAAWDAALAVAKANLADRPAVPDNAEAPRIVRLKSGRVQLRRHRDGTLTRAGEQAFLAALSATANIRLAARAAGFSNSTFHARARAHAGFAREMRLALQQGCERLEMALLESTLPAACEDDAWRHNDPPAIPPMTVEQALQFLHLHHRTTKLWGHVHHARRLPGESEEEMGERVRTVWRAKQRRLSEDEAIAAALGLARGPRSRHEHAPPLLPNLANVAADLYGPPQPVPSPAKAGFAPTMQSDEPPRRTRNGRALRKHPGLAVGGGWRFTEEDGSE